MQIVLFAVLPKRLALLPAVILSASAILTTVWQCISSHNVFGRGVLPGRTTAQLPDPSTGRIGGTPASQPLVVFHFGVRYNHPLGILSPGAMEAAVRFRAMAAELSTQPRYGLLGMTRWRGGDRDSNDTLMFVMYFRSVEGLQLFAHDRLHLDAWKWLSSSRHRHIAAFHETFVVPAGGYETVYLDCAPTLFGATQALCKRGEEGEEAEVWVKPLVSADAPSLRSMMSRMGSRTAVQS